MQVLRYPTISGRPTFCTTCYFGLLHFSCLNLGLDQAVILVSSFALTIAMLLPPNIMPFLYMAYHGRYFLFIWHACVFVCMCVYICMLHMIYTPISSYLPYRDRFQIRNVQTYAARPSCRWSWLNVLNPIAIAKISIYGW